VIPADIGRALGVRASGTWRPAPGGGPAAYATSVPFLLDSAHPERAAGGLAARLRPEPWVAAADVTGGGYLTVTVTAAKLAGLAVRVPAAGAGCLASDALTGTELRAPAAGPPQAAQAATWAQARRLVAATVTARLAGSCGATVIFEDPERGASTHQAGPVAAAVAFAGAEAIWYALASQAPGAAAAVDPLRWARAVAPNPFFGVRYAHARAAAELRWAADLGVGQGGAGAFKPEMICHAAQLELLSAISWLPERAAAAARRGRPDVFARHLRGLASRWLDCAERHPALPSGGGPAPGDDAGAAARLWLAAAAQTALATGLGLLGVAAPARL
jgi:arginyl-tRNA synthetase